jgi:hypothetical protein
MDYALMVFGIPLVVSLGVTLGVELAVVSSASGWGFGTERDVLAVVAVNLITNPLLLWTTYMLTFFLNASPGGTIVTWLPLEVLVVLAEWVLLRWALKKGWLQCLKLSLAMNGASFAVGLGLTLALTATGLVGLGGGDLFDPQLSPPPRPYSGSFRVPADRIGSPAGICWEAR